MKNKLLNFYDKQYKKLLIIPFLILVLALVQLGVQYGMTGDFVNKGVSLKGGSTITIDQQVNILELEGFLQENFPKADISVRSLTQAGTQIGVAVDTDAQDAQEVSVLLDELESKLGLEKGDYGVEIMGSSLGKSFFRQTIIALGIAFLLMGVVVFFYFRTMAPSLAVILAAFSDMVVTLAIFNLTGMRLSTAGIAAFLMLIGYSVDTDVLLSTRVLKRKEGSVMDRVISAMKTGLTMSATTLTAIFIALIFVKSEVIKQIMIILLIGLLVDLIMTWIQNVGLLRLYLERKKP
ncbi:protein translocase subunit SecF [Candidatus Woesearchaeota archaeon]|jgi:preprotein translocase subunit SecF|nr:protein translocase subunit SecF [Candidatus Woesearchaeota archaeon]